MQKALRLLVLALVTVAFAGAGFAADKSMEKTEKASSDTKSTTKAKSVTTTGEVTSVDAKAGTLTVKGKDKDINLNATSRAKAALGHIKAGDTVKVTYTEKDGQLNASSVSLVKDRPKSKDTASDKTSSKSDMSKSDMSKTK